MTNAVKLTKTQAATLAEILRIETTDEPAVQVGTMRKGIWLNALPVLWNKGLIRTHDIEGVGVFVLSTDAGQAWR